MAAILARAAWQAWQAFAMGLLGGIAKRDRDKISASCNWVPLFQRVCTLVQQHTNKTVFLNTT